MSRRLVACSLALVCLLPSSCGKDDSATPAPSESSTTGSDPSNPSDPSGPPTQQPSATPAPLGPITPSGAPITVGPPSPAAHIGADCLEPADKARKATFGSLSGATLTGAVLGQGRAGVVLAHQSNGDLCQWLPYARILARAGYLVLTFDLEGSGSSGLAQYEGDQPGPFGLDVAGAVRYLRSKGADRVVLLGASMGGLAVLAGGAVVKPAVDGVISLSAPAQYASIDARTAATRLTVPVLYVAAQDDGDFATDARTLHKATESEKQLLIVPGILHGVAFMDAGGDESVRKAVATFLAEHARRPG